ncbi:MAG: class I SAM-dependent methyltransferase [Verrucomicrobiota bacterium]|nr:class I SAM-dependent methyltransferase [Limisphaerales bacterium]
MNESRYIEKKIELPAMLIERAEASHPGEEFTSEAEWWRCVQADFPKFIPFLTQECGLEFRGRILEIGAGAAWFSAELSKLPPVVEIIATDASARLLKQQAPKVFKLLQAHAAKITRMPADFGKLDFPANHFDAVVCADALNRAVNMLRVLREVRRVLKPGGQFVAIREPVRPLVRFRSAPQRTARSEPPAGLGLTRADYGELFTHAGLKLEIKRVNLSKGVKYYFDQAVNGLTHARFVFVGTKTTR